MLNFNFQWLTEHAEAVVAVVAMGATGLSWFWLHVRKLHKALNHIAQIPEELADISKRVKVIEAEIRTNGRSSLKDAVIRIDNKCTWLRHVQLGQSEFMGKPFLLFDSRGHLTFANRAALECLDADIEEITGTGWLSFYEGLAEDWERSVSGGSAFRRVVTVNGTHQEWSIRPMRDGKELLGWIGSIQAK